MNRIGRITILLFVKLFFLVEVNAKVKVGIDVLCQNDAYSNLLTQRKIGLITNHTAVNKDLLPTLEVLKKLGNEKKFSLAAYFAPEHGFYGIAYQSEAIANTLDNQKIPIFSLHGKTRRPTPEMLKNIDLLIYDIQDIGSRSYTYISTLFYAMEEAAKAKLPVLVLDRPNPINGLVVDGPMVRDEWRSFVGYINVPYCHGMTVGELAEYFNKEYKIGCDLTVIPMEGWRRSMSFQDTGLTWIPTSPHIPEATTPFYYPITGILGELQIVSIGVGYTLPFKIIGAPWIDADKLAEQLNAQNFPGVQFVPFHFRPFYGQCAHQDCHGVHIIVTNPKIYKPVSTQYLILGILKNLYPDELKKALESKKSRLEMFSKVNGTDEVYNIMVELDHIIWPLRGLHQKEREQFIEKRKKYLISTY